MENRFEFEEKDICFEMELYQNVAILFLSMSIFNIFQNCISRTGVYLHVEYSVTYNDDFFCVCILLRYFLENLQAPTCIRHLGHCRAVSVPRKWCPWLECQSNVYRIIRNHPHRKQVWIVGRRHVLSIKCYHIRMQQFCTHSNLCYHLCW